MNDWHYIPFYARCYFFIFQSPYVFIKLSVVKVFLVAEIAFVVSETIFKTSFCNTKLLIISFTGYWYNCFRYIVCCWTFVIGWAFGFISTTAFMVIRSRLNILPLWEAMTEPIFLQQLAQLCRIFIKDFWHFMMSREMAVVKPISDQCSPSYGNQLIDLQCKSIDWFLYDGEHWSLMG